jgi:tetratricopeptide (TPR) repeat protein
VLFALSLMSKPVLVTLPALMLLLDWWRRGQFGPASWKLVILEKVPLFALSLLITALTIAATAELAGVASLERLPLTTRAANALLAYQTYLAKVFWPMDLAVFYPHPGLSTQLPDPMDTLYTALALVMLTGISAAAIFWRNEVPALLAGWLWFLGALVPNLGLIQAGQQRWADRFSYFALLGLFLALAAVGNKLAGRLRLPAIVQAAVVGFVGVALGVVTWIQVGYWKDSRTLYERTLAVTEYNGFIHGLLGMHLAETGELAEAERQLALSMASAPLPQFDFTYGHVLLERGRQTGKANAERVQEARRHLERAIRLKPSYGLAYYELAVAQIAQGELAAARKTLTTGLDKTTDPHLQANLKKLLEHCEERSPAAPR